MILDLFRKDLVFENINGYDEIKDIAKRVRIDKAEYLKLRLFYYV